MADKIDRLTIGSTSYDIDLPPDATPSISGLTVSGNVSDGTKTKTMTQLLSGGIHETGDASLEDYHYFSHTLYGSGKIIITSMQDPYSSWNFNLECNGDTVVSNIVYAEIIVNREEIVCCNYVDTSGNWNSLASTGSYDNSYD